MNLQIEKLEDIQCPCGNAEGQFPSKRYKEVFDKVKDPEGKVCIMEIVRGLVEGELALHERRYLIDLIVMQLVAMNAYEAMKLDAMMENSPAAGRGNN